jgi:DNA-nicking Smr family endonuclease
VSDGADDDARAFAEAMRGAKPLEPDGRGRVPGRPAPARGGAPRRVGGAPADVDLERPLGAGGAFAIETTGESIAARAPGVDARRLRRLKAGEPGAEARLDLHGRAREEALRALERFIAAARDDGKRCVLVIHGRGAHSEGDAPVLKPLVWRWLADAPASAAAVLAFASARPAEGGDGATRVLLRKPER